MVIPWASEAVSGCNILILPVDTSVLRGLGGASFISQIDPQRFGCSASGSAVLMAEVHWTRQRPTGSRTIGRSVPISPMDKAGVFRHEKMNW
jgi:hypothetical protein